MNIQLTRPMLAVPVVVPTYASALKPELEELARDMLVTGAVVMVRSVELGDWTTTIGTRTYQGTDAVQPDDHIRIGSVTKTWTATVMLQIVEEGKIALSDPVTKYRPDVPNGDKITIQQMLSMRTGLSNYTKALELNEAMDNTPSRVWKPEELLALAYALPVTAEPGTAFEYSNTNTVLLGLIIEQVTGQTLTEAIQERVLDRVGMAESSFPEPTDALLPGEHAHGYSYGSNVETIDSLVLPKSVQKAASEGECAPLDVTDVNPSWAWSAGAGISTAPDLAAYAVALTDGTLLGPKLQQQRLDSIEAVIPKEPESPGYGLGLAQFGALYGHTGELPGFNTFMGHDPHRDITVVVWTSLEPAADGRAPATTLARAVIGALYST